MKKVALLLILALGFTYVNSQLSVTLLKNRDFIGFNSAYDQISVLEIDRQGNIWFNLNMNTEIPIGAGFCKFTGEEWVSFNTAYLRDLLSPFVNAIAFDLKDSVWVGTDKGLAQFDGKSPVGWKIYNAQNSKIPDKITAITIDNNNTKWIGFSTGLLASFDGNQWEFKKDYEGKAINDLESDLEGNIWVARAGNPGLLKYKDGQFTPFSALTDIRNIKVDQDGGRILVTSLNSLVIFKNDQIVEIIQPDPELGCKLYEVEYDDSIGTFVSSDIGLLEKQVGSKFRFYSKDNSALPDLVGIPKDNLYPVPIVFDGKGKLWFSFIYEGISYSYASIGYIEKTIMTIAPPRPINKSTYKFCYNDSITLDANVDAAKYVWDGIPSTSKTYTLYDTKTIELAVAYEEKCNLTDTFRVLRDKIWFDSIIYCVNSSQSYAYTSATVIAQHVYEDEKPCVVTVSPDYKNLLVWERTRDVGTVSYNIYKEIPFEDTVKFDLIGNIPAGQLSVFEDYLSNPKKKSAKYKIASVDTCGNESGPSFYHKTMHLQLSFGMDSTEVNLAWENYEGFWFPYYIIYRGTDPENLYPVDSVLWDDNNLTWTDYPVLEHTYYRVGVQLPFLCEPAGDQGKKADSGPYSHSMSQIEDNRFQTSIKDQGIKEIQSYPNPFSQWTQINFENPKRVPYQLKVTDMSGKMVRTISDITDNKVILLRENLPQGFYMFELNGDQVYRGKLVVK